jgi:SAM-dependent methyltransferase
MGRAERYARCRALVRKYYRGVVPTREAAMDAVVLPLLRPGDSLLDAGCGDTLALLKRYGPLVSFAAGVDLGAPSEKRPGRTGVAVGDLRALPFRDAVFDVVVSRSVVEHLEHPVAVFAELRRVLKPGGCLVFTTPNKYYYSSLIASMIPFTWKDRVIRRVFEDDGEAYDHFPVFYRANTRAGIRRVAAKAGLRVTEVRALRHFPYYFLFSPTLFRLGMLYDWVVTWLRLDGLQSTWLVVMARP